MKPVSPVVFGMEEHEIKIAESQDEYQTLPALPVNAGEYIVTRWRLSWRERLVALFNGDIFLSVWTFQQPLQPVLLEVDQPKLLVGLTWNEPVDE